MQTSKRVGESLVSCGKMGNGINLTSIPPFIPYAIYKQIPRGEIGQRDKRAKKKVQVDKLQEHIKHIDSTGKGQQAMAIITGD